MEFKRAWIQKVGLIRERRKALEEVMGLELSGPEFGPGQVTLFDGVGFATEDFSALRYVRDRLADAGECQQLDIIADPDDPRDLYGMLQRAKE